MTTLQAILTVLILFLGTAILAVNLNRTRTTRQIRNRLLLIAENMWSDAEDSNQTHDPMLVHLHNMVIESAALAPMIASGVVEQDPDATMSQRQREELESFINRSAWILGYLYATHMAVSRLEFHARPWNVRRWPAAIFACVFMALMSRRDGSVRLFENAEQATQGVESIARLNTRDRADRIAYGT